ncbi:uncharacterized protein EI90DRAFT_3019218 [Cantharellus anzutake]|uniref:uncharacterized protein n=1 Tax=Cantharellus anzutake TaxID=1750568 RepID=UPI0019075013|nr:uncharacterized protein EI90DRAFT_3019218 [Cantharellus anzutake]KAF8325261.1 hypothetical protein EI90DRAFT_3019218 [Cantharellus anzutake]
MPAKIIFRKGRTFLARWGKRAFGSPTHEDAIGFKSWLYCPYRQQEFRKYKPSSHAEELSFNNGEIVKIFSRFGNCSSINFAKGIPRSCIPCSSYRTSLSVGTMSASTADASQTSTGEKIAQSSACEVVPSDNEQSFVLDADIVPFEQPGVGSKNGVDMKSAYSGQIGNAIVVNVLLEALSAVLATEFLKCSAISGNSGMPLYNSSERINKIEMGETLVKGERICGRGLGAYGGGPPSRS